MPTTPGAARTPASCGSASAATSEAARLIACADVGIVPFKREPFNDAALPYRILKYALLGRATVSPELAGVHTWDRAVTTAADADAFAAALRAHAGARVRPTRRCASGRWDSTARRSTTRCGSGWRRSASTSGRRRRASHVRGERRVAGDGAVAGRRAVVGGDAPAARPKRLTALRTGDDERDARDRARTWSLRATHRRWHGASRIQRVSGTSR